MLFAFMHSNFLRLVRINVLAWGEGVRGLSGFLASGPHSQALAPCLSVALPDLWLIFALSVEVLGLKKYINWKAPVGRKIYICPVYSRAPLAGWESVTLSRGRGRLRIQRWERLTFSSKPGWGFSRRVFVSTCWSVWACSLGKCACVRNEAGTSAGPLWKGDRL